MTIASVTTGWTRQLPAVAVEVLESVAQHRLLTTAQVHVMHTPEASRRWTQRLLGALAGYGLVDAVRGPRGVGVWFATASGLTAVEQFAVSRAEPRRKVIEPAHAAGPLQAHTLGVNEVGIAFLLAARQRGDEVGPLSWRHEIAHTTGRRHGAQAQVIADALISYLATDGDAVALHQRFVELDRATMPVEHLLDKIRAYARLRDHEPGWRPFYPAGMPDVLLVLAGKPRARLERRLRLLLALRADDLALAADGHLHVSLALLEDLTAHGPFAPIWLRAENPTRRVDWLGRPKGASR